MGSQLSGKTLWCLVGSVVQAWKELRVGRLPQTLTQYTGRNNSREGFKGTVVKGPKDWKRWVG